ncbi:hypothetical protein K504DRAFT_450071 [Pleomassaria siparia CBS 279.74]|uniref:Uncharacterized protein n=1 Tax=Pleomassaria siparia CBS 279.74 TaxID=1314801 RepID=A0A6G1KLE3_9PLEO|nr:hypothetical protein K504DRAFT_450071 [Pleomassaria siparia CBS 279.74]
MVLNMYSTKYIHSSRELPGYFRPLIQCGGQFMDTSYQKWQLNMNNVDSSALFFRRRSAETKFMVTNNVRKAIPAARFGERGYKLGSGCDVFPVLRCGSEVGDAYSCQSTGIQNGACMWMWVSSYSGRGENELEPSLSHMMGFSRIACFRKKAGMVDVGSIDGPSMGRIVAARGDSKL